MLFKELMPLIQHRPLTITVVADGDTRLRINVIPQKLDKDREANNKITHAHRKEVAEIPTEALAALTTPLSVTGTPAELDADLPKALTDFVSQHATLQQSVDNASTQISAAVKAIDEREKTKKAQEKRDSRDKTKNDEKKASSGAGSKDEKNNTEESILPSLFMAAPQRAVSANDKVSNGSSSELNSSADSTVGGSNS